MSSCVVLPLAERSEKYSRKSRKWIRQNEARQADFAAILSTVADLPAKPPLQIQPSRHFPAWLRESGISLAFTTYQTNRLFLVGTKEDGNLSVFERQFDRPMGLCGEPERLIMNTRWQLWELDNALPPGMSHEGADRLYVPRRAHTTGDIDMHDIAVDQYDRILFINTAYSCLATLSDHYSFKPLWQPPFISRVTPEDRCHLNGLAMDDGEAAYVTTVSRSDVTSGWRERRHQGGCLIDVRSGEIVTDGLSMPHSPRLYQGRLWVLNSGSGEFGYVEPASGRFEPVAFCPGFIRGLAFCGDYAIVGLSKPRREEAFSGLVLDDWLTEKDADARCGLWVIDLKGGVIAHWLELEGVVVELYDVQVLHGVKRPKALGFKTDEIQRLITIDAIEQPIFQALATKAVAPGAGGAPQPNPPVAAAPEAAAANDEYRAANQLLKDGRLEDAVQRYIAALLLDPRHVKALANLGTVYAGMERSEDAIACYRRALECDPGSVIAHRNLAAMLEWQGDAAGAIEHYQRAAAGDPDDAAVRNQLGMVLLNDGRIDAAKDAFDAAVRLAPGAPEGYNHLAAIARIEKDFDLALALNQRALELDPSFLVAHENIARLHEDQGRTTEAKQAYSHAREGRPDAVLELHAELLCPPIFAGVAEIDAYRTHAEEVIDAAQGRVMMAHERVQSSRCEPPFEWAYHGRDNLVLKQKYAALFRPSFRVEPLARRPSADGPWCLGFVVTPGHEGVFARCMGGILNQLDAARFEIVVAVTRARAETLRGDLRNPAIRYLNLPLRFDQTVATLRAAELDLLYLWEVGTDAVNYFLPFLRLAPVQVTGWGWPETSGAPELDAHLTSAALAPPGIEASFTEKLVRLPALTPCFPRVPVPERPHTPAHFGLPDDAHLYVCAQSLRKIHPDFDTIVGGILHRDPEGIAVFVADTHARLGELLQERWAKTLPDDIRDRVVLLPRLGHEEYFHLLARANVVLDPLYFGGAVTMYDTFGVGTPVVTLPSDQPRARHAAALCELAGVTEACIAATSEEYIERAVRLGCDAVLRSDVSRQIGASADKIFEQRAAVGHLAEFFVTAIRSAGR